MQREQAKTAQACYDRGSLPKEPRHDLLHVLRLRPRVQADFEQPAGHPGQGRSPRRRQEDRPGRADAIPFVPRHAGLQPPDPDRRRLRQGLQRPPGVDVPSYEDSEQTFAELKARISKTLAFIDSVPQAEIEASAERAITTGSGEKTRHFTGQEYLLHYALPHFFFHATTAYDILRHNGVEIGKKNFIGSY